MIVALIIAAWFFLGWLGYRIIIEADRLDSDVTRKDRRVYRWCILAGISCLIAGLAIYGEQRSALHTVSRDNDIIYPRKDTT